MNKKIILVGCAALLAVTVAVGLWFRSSQKNIDGVELEYAGEIITIPYEELNKGAFHGELVNGKGERMMHDYEGIELQDLLKTYDVELEHVASVSVVSADHYSAVLEGDEVRETSKIYLAVAADGETLEGIDAGTKGAQLIVFGDPDSKRCVRFVKTIKIS